MDFSKVKCRVLAKLSNDLRLTIDGDLENLRFGLYAAGLISLKVRDKKESGDMVSEIENRLETDELVWNKLIDLLNKYDKEAMSKKLSKGLSEETGGGSVGCKDVPAKETVTRAQGTKAYRYFKLNYSDICSAIAGENSVIPQMADSLEAKELITNATRQAVQGTSSLTPYEKATKLMGPLRGKLEQNPELITKLIEVLRKCGLNELADDLERSMCGE